MDLDNFESIVSTLDFTMDTQRKRHILGGILLSISMFFGGLAFTVMTIKINEEINDE
jgi:hypothetical protein